MRQHALIVGLLLCGALSATAESGTIVIDHADCALLAQHVPAPDVAYEPGVDVDGRPVVPADLDPSPVLPPPGFRIDITVLLQDRLGLPQRRDPFRSEARIGVVTVAPDGRAWFNGQPLHDPEQKRLVAYCRTLR